MIPKKLDYTKDECRGALRHLGLLTNQIMKDKKKFSQKNKAKTKF
jgi:hypothetical protein